MSIARFSPFELLLLKSRSQVDTAKLLLLAWVLVHRQHVSEGQRRRRLAQVSVHFRHGHELAPIIHIAQQQDLKAIQLAAEVLRKECSKEHSLGVMHQAITVATDSGELSLANHYILRFLADLLNVEPLTLNTLFQELTGSPLATPEDPSRDAYWRIHDADYYAQKAREAEAAQQQAREAQEKAERQEKKRQQEEAERAHSKAQAEAERERNRQQEHARRQEQREHKKRQQRESQQEGAKQRSSYQRASSPPPPDRTARALAVLGLMPGASQVEVRKAYRRMAQLHHPDRFYTESEHQIALASARFQRIKSAYDYLMHTYR
ncbi:J domain-containing protein [Vreelandella nanhaiensis]|uniref:Molecular chaperone DnaJ n=1 Tax=Vreelandella nanhaiensis TaxID=1258546 RepID=A0A3S0WC45_9GAMM|nr:J domain-containing protein [Halomonas nanhaiensis]RUR34241.1 molecular chaperone DnaJ [Halomonas nanhaiensis]